MKMIERLKSAITDMLRKGTAPEQIATALALGAVLGTLSAYDRLLTLVAEQGYDPARVHKVPQQNN